MASRPRNGNTLAELVDLLHDVREKHGVDMLNALRDCLGDERPGKERSLQALPLNNVYIALA